MVWLPLVALGAYLAVLALRLPSLIDQLTWDGDAVSQMVLASGLHTPDHGQIYLANPNLATLAFDYVVAPLPIHRALWVWSPVLLPAATAGLLALMVWRLAGRRSALLTLVLVVAASPAMLQNDVETALHATASLGTALCAGAVVLALTGEITRSRAALVVAAASILGGIALASDLLTGITGLLPLLVAAGFVAIQRGPRWRLPALTMGLAAVGAGVVSLALVAASRRVGISPVGGFLSTRELAREDQVITNAKLLISGILRVFNGYFLGSRPHGGSITEVLCAGLGLWALGALLRRAWRVARRPRQAHPGQVAAAAFLVFWGTSVVSLAATFVFTTVPVDRTSVRYLGTLVLAAAATVPVMLRLEGLERQEAPDRREGVEQQETSDRQEGPEQRGDRNAVEWRRRAAGLGVAVFALSSGAQVNGAARTESFRPEHTHGLDEVIRYLDDHNLTRGYGPYFDALPITYRTGGRIEIYPAAACAPTPCARDVNTLGGWYAGHRPGPTFILTDPVLPDMPNLGAAQLTPTESQSVGRFTVHVFPGDVGGTFLSPR